MGREEGGEYRPIRSSVTAETEMTLAVSRNGMDTDTHTLYFTLFAFPRARLSRGRDPRVLVDDSAATSALRGRIHIDSQPWKTSRVGWKRWGETGGI